MNKSIPLELDTIITLKKYPKSDTTTQQIIDHDVSYMRWMIEEAGFELSNSAYDYYSKAVGES